ncbi:MAG: hypothetical protein ACI8R4_002617 [Paracoccaceae bacterium]|jgi:hypothetical protein
MQLLHSSIVLMAIVQLQQLPILVASNTADSGNTL